MKSMLEINLGEHKENSVASTTITFDEPVEHTEVSFQIEMILLTITLVVVAVVFFAVRNTYINKKKLAMPEEEYTGYEKLSAKKLYIDEIYDFLCSCWRCRAFGIWDSSKTKKNLGYFQKEIASSGQLKTQKSAKIST